MILASNGIIASQIASFDADALAFFERVTAAGGTLSATEKIATNQLVLDLKANSLWTPMKAIYPMVGASAAACAQNLKSSSFTGTFTSGWTFASTGVTPNGTSAYFDTGLNGRTSLNNLRHFSMYNNQNTSGIIHIGSLDNINGEQDYIGLGSFQIWRLNNKGSSIGRSSTSKGLWIAKNSLTTVDLLYNNSLLSSVVGVTTNTANVNYYLATGPLGSNFSSTSYAFASIGDGLTDTQASNFYTAVQAFQTTLSRQV